MDGAGVSTAGVAAMTGVEAGADMLPILSHPASINAGMQSAAMTVLALLKPFVRPEEVWFMERFLKSEVLPNQRSP